MIKKTIVGLIILIISIFVISCIEQVPVDDTKISKELTRFETSQGLKKFSSQQELIGFLEESAKNSGSGIRRDFEVMESAAPQMAKSAAGSSAAAGSSEYSQTNVQVAGVDEADFVKNDDKYIYAITQNKLVIVDAYPAENAEVLSETKLAGNPRNMFVNKGRLVVFSDGNDEVAGFSPYDFRPSPRYTQKTHAFVYDISDRKNPKLVKDYNLNGYYFESRMIGDYVYFIAQENVYYYNRLIDIPVIMESAKSAKMIVRPDIYYFDNPENNYNFNTVASFDILSDADDVNAKTFMMGYSNNIYVSKNNIYISYQKNFPYTYYESHNENRFFDVVVPLLTSDAQNKIKDIRNDNSLNSYQRWDKLSSVLEEMYNKMDESGKNELIQKIENDVNDYEAKLEAERRKTVIHRINIDNGRVVYGAKGEVSGYLLNQFSMDEYEGNLRVATTFEFYGSLTVLPMRGIETSVASVSSGSPSTGEAVSEAPVSISNSVNTTETEDYWTEEKMENAKPMSMEVSAPIAPPNPRRDWVMYNNVFVLDDKMETVGKLEALAPDERIYSARFIRDRLYMVTFKRIDPLFVIDLSSPEKPEVLGELKIPGFSDYLHPYDENHIIGIGKETEGNEWGGVSTKGVKLALFDVSDVKNPKQLSKYEIGESGTDSEALRDHKAFLFDKNKNLLVIPVTEVKGKLEYDPRVGYYKQRYWQGAYVFGLTPEKGFEVKGKITHNEGDENQDWYWYGSPNAVRRSLYMDDVLYTISGIKIKANDLNNIDNEIKVIKLPYEKEDYPYPVYKGGVGIAETVVVD